MHFLDAKQLASLISHVSDSSMNNLGWNLIVLLKCMYVLFSVILEMLTGLTDEDSDHQKESPLQIDAFKRQFSASFKVNDIFIEK